MPRAVIYARYSSDNQRDASIEDQLRLCKEHLSRAGWTLTQVFRDAAMSAASTFRPGYQALLQGVRTAEFDVIVAEALDRLSRDQEDVAALYKRCSFAGVRIVTLAEGEITELHVGLKGTMNALFLKDLADKTRRGLRGRVEVGASGGGLTFGYDVVRSVDRRGERRINDAEAAVVRRIFEQYRDGKSPKRIAHDLNAYGVPGPRGGQWAASTINGNKDRGTGILNNELYIGRMIWNRLRYSKDPDTGKRRSRLNDQAAVVAKDVPELRIIPDTLWLTVRARQAALGKRDQPSRASDEQAPFWTKQRPKHLFSGLMRCGQCGGGYSKVGARHFGCSTAANKGPTGCTNKQTIRDDHLEQRVLSGLQDRLMDPVLYQQFASAFTAEWNRQQAEASGELEARKAELSRVKGQLERLVDALCNGAPAATVRDRMSSLEERRELLEVELRTAQAPAPRLHPNLPTLYRQHVAGLTEALKAPEADATREALRALIDAVQMIPEQGGLRVEIRGELSSILGLAGQNPTANSAAEGSDAVSFARQVKLVAGTGFEPVTFRL